jgi:hypothetical protein
VHACDTGGAPAGAAYLSRELENFCAGQFGMACSNWSIYERDPRFRSTTRNFHQRGKFYEVERALGILHRRLQTSHRKLTGEDNGRAVPERTHVENPPSEEQFVSAKLSGAREVFEASQLQGEVQQMGG